MRWNLSSEELNDQFHAILESFPVAQPRKMFGYSCCFVNNNLFTGLQAKNLIVRLSEEDRNELIASHNASHFDPMGGKPMREYLVLPSTILSSPQLLEKWMKRSFDYASSLPPKQKKGLKKARTRA